MSGGDSGGFFGESGAVYTQFAISLSTG